MSDVASVQEEYVAELRAEIQQLRDALEQASVRLGELTQPPWNELTPLVAEVRDDIRAALAGTPSEDTE